MSEKSPDSQDCQRAERAADKAEEATQTADPLAASFDTLILSMSTNALVHLGDAPEEFFGGEARPPVNLPMAKHSIDMLGLLEEKTQGNLSGEEERLLSTVLYDLRMRYVAATKR